MAIDRHPSRTLAISLRQARVRLGPSATDSELKTLVESRFAAQNVRQRTKKERETFDKMADEALGNGAWRAYIDTGNRDVLSARLGRTRASPPTTRRM